MEWGNPRLCQRYREGFGRHVGSHKEPMNGSVRSFIGLCVVYMEFARAVKPQACQLLFRSFSFWQRKRTPSNKNTVLLPQKYTESNHYGNSRQRWIYSGKRSQNISRVEVIFSSSVSGRKVPFPYKISITISATFESTKATTFPATTISLICGG